VSVTTARSASLRWGVDDTKKLIGVVGVRLSMESI
jgi:hypothetical protein